MLPPLRDNIEPYWVLDEDGKARPAKDVHEWADFVASDRRLMGDEQAGDYWVVTVFEGFYVPGAGVRIAFTGVFPRTAFEPDGTMKRGSLVEERCAYSVEQAHHNQQELVLKYRTLTKLAGA